MKKINFLVIIAATAFLIAGFAFKTERPAKEGLNIGDKAPELTLADPMGKVIKLSSLKGNIVLIDFWASWCGPCRRENPAVVGAYNKFKSMNFKNGKEFKIYSVSLDENKASWINAIGKDGLEWPTHVSDLGGWNSQAAQIYEISSIPSNFLIDGNGIIVAKALRGAQLDIALEKLLEK